MSKEYIEREAAIKEVAKWLADVFGIKSESGAGTLFKKLRSIPAADVVEVRHGRWILNTVRDEWQQFHSDPECSECGFHPYYYHDHSVMKYCPNCGAKMDGGADDE